MSKKISPLRHIITTILACSFLTLGALGAFPFPITCSLPDAYAMPTYGLRPCLRPSYPQPFTGISACDWVNSTCAALSGLFTWTPADTTVDSGYERVRNFFIPEGWRKYNQDGTWSAGGLSRGIPLRQIGAFQQQIHPISPGLLWKRNKDHNITSIAYIVLHPVPFSDDLYAAITQLEYSDTDVDRNTMPLPTAHLIAARLWEVIVLFAEDGSTKISRIDYSNFEHYFTGEKFFDSQHTIHLDHDQQEYAKKYAIMPAPKNQTPTQRWSCQKIVY